VFLFLFMFYCSSNEIDLVKRKADLAEKAAHIIAVSENTKKDIIEILGISEKKISVVYHSSSIKSSPEYPQRKNIAEPYILYVGDRVAEYKNFKFFIRAIVPVLKENPHLKVKCCGNAFDAKECYMFESMGITAQMQCEYASDSKLVELYQHALCLVYPSYCEGFGIPILEAFQNNCPVILANASCFPEVGADAAIYFEPKHFISLQQALRSMLNNPELRFRCIENGKVRMNSFSWAKSALETTRIYQAL